MANQDKIRIHQLAKDIEREWEEVASVGFKLGFNKKSASSSVTADQAETITASFQGAAAAKATKPAKKAATRKGTIVSYDQRTGIGQVRVDKVKKPVKFDLRYTTFGNLEDFPDLKEGKSVEVEVSKGHAQNVPVRSIQVVD